MAKKTLFPTDELNRIESWTESIMDNGQDERKKREKDIADELLEFFLFCYLSGHDSVTSVTEENLNVSESEMRDAIYARFDGKTWEDRLSEYIASGGTEEELKRMIETESHRDYCAGQFNTAKDSSFSLKKRWVTMMDEKVRDTHSYLEGMKVPVNAKFYTYDGDSSMYPGGFSLPENNINCRCELEITKE